MRLRLGLLQESAAIQKQEVKEAAEAAAKRHKHPTQTIKTEAETIADEKAAARARERAEETETKKAPRVRIRPLSEAKAVESGATFISEAFLFTVAGSLIFLESWRSRRKETSRREDVADRLSDLEESEKAARRALVELEREVLRLRAKEDKDVRNPLKRILPREVWDVKENPDDKEDQKELNWISRLARLARTTKEDDTARAVLAADAPGPAETILGESDAALAATARKREDTEAMARAATGNKPS